MLNKTFFRIIILLAICLLIVPQVQAQDYGAEMQKLTADLMAGKISKH